MTVRASTFISLLSLALSHGSLFCGLPPLPIPHINSFTPGVPPEAMSLDNEEWLDLVRITGTAFLNGISDPTRTDVTLRSTPENVIIAVTAAAKFNATLGISYSPYIDFLPNFSLGPKFWPPPTDTSFESAVLGYFAENMQRLTTWVAEANSLLSTCVPKAGWLSIRKPCAGMVRKAFTQSGRMQLHEKTISFMMHQRSGSPVHPCSGTDAETHSIGDGAIAGLLTRA